MTATAYAAKLRLLVVDDQQIIIDGLTSILEGSKAIEVIGGCTDARQLLEAIEALRPDVVLIDLNMPVMDGIECIERVLAHHPQQRFLMLTGYDDTELIREALAKGAMGYVLKNIAKDELILAIETVHAGRRYLDQQVQDKVIGAFLDGGVAAKEPAVTMGENTNLSKREIEVLRLIAEGKTSGKIAEQLFISTNTVDTHRKNIMAKCGVRNIAELVSFANRNDLV